MTADPKTHFDLLKTVWFNLYSRGQGKIGSSAFEHVFMGETKSESLTGLHNWIWYYYREHETNQNNVIDYKGYMKSIPLGDVSILSFEINYINIMNIRCSINKPFTIAEGSSYQTSIFIRSNEQAC